ncbi:hypothetical protein HPB48_003498 [Haemaphysalis longicornis]|uniref:Globin domain-containing protein n=1 Tax=Haemaphysalis longicornis TaxID=44386 RepID=A0A9J6GZG6_HAELO|nr:hypothetical protein HPB48_003498 [Haemaphysalis longicornis]
MARVRAETRPSAKRRQENLHSDTIVKLGLVACVIARGNGCFFCHGSRGCADSCRARGNQSADCGSEQNKFEAFFTSPSLSNVRRNHAIKFGDQLNNLIEALDKPAVLADLMRKTSHLHAGHKGVKPEHFVTMGRVIINVLTANHDRLMTGPAVKAWEKLFVIALRTISDALVRGTEKVHGAGHGLVEVSREWFLLLFTCGMKKVSENGIRLLRLSGPSTIASIGRL